MPQIIFLVYLIEVIAASRPLVILKFCLVITKIIIISLINSPSSVDQLIISTEEL